MKKNLSVIGMLLAGVLLVPARPVPAPALRVVDPSGVAMCKGKVFHVQWEGMISEPGRVRLVLFQNGKKVGVIARNLKSLNSFNFYDWTAGQYEGGMALPGTGYRIVVRLEGGTAKGTSEEPFVIRPAKACLK